MSRLLSNRVFMFLRNALSFCAVRVRKECQYLFGTGQSHDVRAAQRGDLYTRQFVDNMIEDCAGKYDPYDLECSVAMPCTIFSINLGEIVLHKAHLIGLSTLYPAGVCSLIEQDDKLYISASLGAGPLQYQCEVKARFGSLEREATILLSSEYIKILLSFNINRETGRNGCLLNTVIHELNGFKLAINGLGYLDWPLNLFLRASTTVLNMMIRNLLENELEKYILDKLPNHQFPVEGTCIKLNRWQITRNVDHESKPIKSKDFRAIVEPEDDTKTSVSAPLAEKVKGLCKNEFLNEFARACNREPLITNLFNNEREVKEKDRPKTKLEDLFHNMEKNSNLRRELTPREIAFKKTCEFLREKGSVPDASNRFHDIVRELKTEDKPTSSIEKIKKTRLQKTVAGEKEFANMMLDLYSGYHATKKSENSSQTPRIIRNFVPGEKKVLDNFGNSVTNCSSSEDSIFRLDDYGSLRRKSNRPFGTNEEMTGSEVRNLFRTAAGEIGSEESRIESSGNASNSRFPTTSMTKSAQSCKRVGNKILDLSEKTCKDKVKASSINKMGKGVLEYKSDLKSASAFRLLDHETSTEASSTTSELISREEFPKNLKNSESVEFLDNQFPEETLIASNTNKLSVLLLNMVNSSSYKDAFRDITTLPLNEKCVSSREVCSDHKTSYPKKINLLTSTLNVNSSKIPQIKADAQVPNDNGSPKMYSKSEDCNIGGDNLVQEAMSKTDVMNGARAKSSNSLVGDAQIYSSMDALLATETEEGNDRRKKWVEEISSKTSDKLIQSNEDGMFSAISSQEVFSEMGEEFIEKMKLKSDVVRANLEELKIIHMEVEEKTERYLQEILLDDKDEHDLSEVKDFPSTSVDTEDSLLDQTAKFNTEGLDTSDTTMTQLHQYIMEGVKELAEIESKWQSFSSETDSEVKTDGRLHKDVVKGEMSDSNSSSENDQPTNKSVFPTSVAVDLSNGNTENKVGNKQIVLGDYVETRDKCEGGGSFVMVEYGKGNLACDEKPSVCNARPSNNGVVSLPQQNVSETDLRNEIVSEMMSAEMQNSNCSKELTLDYVSGTCEADSMDTEKLNLLRKPTFIVS